MFEIIRIKRIYGDITEIEKLCNNFLFDSQIEYISHSISMRDINSCIVLISYRGVKSDG